MQSNLSSNYSAMRQDTQSIAPSTRVEVDPSSHMMVEDDLFAQFLVDGTDYFDTSFPSALEETPEETPLDTPDDHFGSAAIDAEITGPMPCFGAEFNKTDSSAAAPAELSCTASVDDDPAALESFGIQLEQLFAFASASVSASSTASIPDNTKPAAPALTHALAPPPTPSLLDNAPYIIDQTPLITSTPLPSTPMALDPSTTFTSSSSSRPTKPLPTGIRRNITVSKLVPLDAPTQPRHYVGESATSRKAVPAAFRKKRAISEVDPAGEDAEAIEDKRRKNTLAARKSRARKLETMQGLQAQVDELAMERNYWQARCVVLEDLVRRSGVELPQP